jgi:hypothetical protein
MVKQPALIALILGVVGAAGYALSRAHRPGGLNGAARPRNKGRRSRQLRDIGPNPFSTLYRSVSPWEMDEILRTQEVKGRCGEFAGDRRCSPDCQTWLATSIAPIIHSGEDYLRYTSSMPVWGELGRDLTKARRLSDDLRAQVERAPDRRTAKRLSAEQYAAHELAQKLGDAYRKAIYAMSKQARESAAKLPATSYVIHFDNVSGGTMYSDQDSQQRDAVEVCMPQSAGGELFKRIAGVDLVKEGPDGNLEAVHHITGDQLAKLRVKLPTIRKTVAQAALTAHAELAPKIEQLRVLA